jgi:hypothetical protein
MAEIAIKDGATGYVAKVDQNRRLHTATVSEPQADHAADTGIEQRYNINTGDITLTNATKTTVLYVKNTGTDDFVIKAFIYNAGNSTSGTGDVKWEVIRNPTAGDIITNANNVEVGVDASANQNFGSSNTMTGLFYKGATGETAVSGGAVTISTRSASITGRTVVDLGAVVLPKGTSVAVDYTPPTSNTSQKIQVALACYVQTITVADVE